MTEITEVLSFRNELVFKRLACPTFEGEIFNHYNFKISHPSEKVGHAKNMFEMIKQ